MRSWLIAAALLPVVSLLTSLGPRASRADEAAPASASGPAPAPAEVVPPRPLESPPPVRPDNDEARARSGEEVTVELELTIDADGAVAAARATAPVAGGFDDAAVAASRQLRFEPARRNGTPVPVRIRYRYVFPPLAPPAPPQAITDDGAAAGAGTGSAARAAAAGGAEVAASVVADEAATSGGEGGGGAPAPDDGESFGATGRVREETRGAVRRTIEGRALTDTAGTRGDALRVIELLPGVARPPLGDGLVVVRGSAPVDSEISFEGMSVLQLYHFGGLTSFVSARLLERIDLHPGNFSVRWGRKIGGIVDVGARDPRMDGLHAVADVNLIDGSVLAEGPIGRRAGVAVAGRRSHIGEVLQATAPSGTFLFAPVYEDYQLFATYRPTGRDRLRFLGYGSRDRLGMVFKASDQDPSLRGNASAETYFHRAQLSWDHRYGERASHALQVTVGTIGWIADIGGAISQDIRGPQLYSRGALDVRPTERLTLSLGYDLALERLTASYHGPGITPSEGDPSGMGPVSGQVLTTINTTATFFRPAAYLEAIWRGPGGLTLAGGGRADYFGDIHRASFDPRLAARLAVGEATAIKGGVGLFSQPPDYGQAVPGFGNPNLEPARALHAGLGVERTVGSDGGWLTVGAEAFAKRLSDLVVRSPGSAAGDGMALVSDGVGRVYGLELLARTRQNARASGFLAYTLSRSERRDAPGAAWRLFDYDQTHILTAAGAVRFGRGWSLGGTFRLASGSPETPVIGSIYDADRDLYRAVFGPVNGTRAPLFHRLDLRVEKQWRPGRMLLALYLDVLNAYNQRKREVTAYGFDYRQQGGVSGLPVLPSLGLRGEL